MKKIIQQLLPYIKNYKKHVVLNIVFNLLYALFSTLAFVSLIPMLNVLFDKTKKKEEKIIESRNVVLFKPSKEFKDLVNLKNNE